jgi:hypothetical protein
MNRSGIRLAVLLSCALLAAAPASAYVLSLEADGFMDSYDSGGRPVEDVDCSGASGGKALEGIDLAGEWISWDVTVDQQAEVRGRVRSAGEAGAVRGYTLSVWYEDGSEMVLSQTVTTPAGTGIS